MPSDTTPCECIPTEMKDIIEQVPGSYSNSDEWVDIAEYEVTTFDDPVCKRDEEEFANSSIMSSKVSDHRLSFIKNLTQGK